MKAIIVAIVLTEEQREDGNSLPTQLTRMQDYCERNDYTAIQTSSFDDSVVLQHAHHDDPALRVRGYTMRVVLRT